MENKDFDPEKDLKFSADARVREIIKKGPTNDATDDEVEEEPQPVEEPYYNENRVIFFDVKEKFFTDFMGQISERVKFEIITDIKNLTSELKNQSKTYLFLNYTDNTNIAHQLIPQVKTKYQNVTVILVAKDLTINMVKQLSSKPYAAHEYLSFPCNQSEFLEMID